MAHPISELMGVTMDKIRSMMDANTVIGQPIEAGGATVLPICRISLRYASGGSDFAQKNQKPEKDNAFGGGAGMGVSITPISLLVIQGESVRVVSVDQPAATAAERIIDLVPGVMDKVGDLIDKKKGNDAPAAEE